jgi:hypothetical protein
VKEINNSKPASFYLFLQVKILLLAASFRQVALETFQAFGTGLSGDLPSELGLMTALHIFDVQSCSLDGKIPITVGGIESLEELLLSKFLLWGNYGRFRTLSSSVASSSIDICFILVYL